MARIMHSGFELNSLADEFQFTNGAGLAISTTTVRTGTYSGALSGTTQNYVQFAGIALGSTFFIRMFVNIFYKNVFLFIL